MNNKEHFQIFPWSSNDEFRSVAKVVLNLEFGSCLLYNLDFLKDLQWIERQLIIWRTKTTSTQHLYEIDLTHSIVNCLIHEYLPQKCKMANQKRSIDYNNGLSMNINDLDEKSSNKLIEDLKIQNDLSNDLSNDLCSDNQFIEINTSFLDLSSFNLFNEETIAVLYSNAILKFFKMLSYYDVIDGKMERLLSRSESNLTKICEQLNFPQYIIEYRHRIAHNKLPPFTDLKFACQIALSWIKKNYWSAYLTLLDDQEKSKMQIFEQTNMILTNIFEINDDIYAKLGAIDNTGKLCKKTNERIPKKQIIESKKFPILDRKDIILLNDTLYDLFIEDFYRTLHAIVLYIVNSTKEYLNDITTDEILEWIKDDQSNIDSIIKESDTNECHKPENQKNDKRLKKKKQLIPYFILNSFKPIFNIINKQLSSINQFLFCLYSIIENEKTDLKKSAQIWFIRIICALINNLNLKKSNKRLRINQLSEFEKCFKLTDSQLTDLKWIHLFTMLVEKPIMDNLNLYIVRRFYPLVSFRYSKEKFNQICDLLSIYLGNENDMIDEKKKTNRDAFDDFNKYFIATQIEDDIDWDKTKFGFI